MARIQSFNYSVNLLRVIPWQFETAERLIEWLTNKQDNLNADQAFLDRGRTGTANRKDSRNYKRLVRNMDEIWCGC